MAKKKDYTKYAKTSKPESEAAAKEPEEIKEPVQLAFDFEESEQTMRHEPVVGVVTDCVRLNVRKRPESTAEVITTIDCLTEVVIDEEQSTDGFYKICTAAGIEGFCMKKFIVIRH